MLKLSVFVGKAYSACSNHWFYNALPVIYFGRVTLTLVYSFPFRLLCLNVLWEYVFLLLLVTMTLIEILDFTCEKYFNKTAIVYHDTHCSKTLTYRDFYYASNLLKERLGLWKLKRRVPVGIFIDNHFCIPSLIYG